MFKYSFRGASLPLALAGTSLSLVLAGCGGGGTNLPAPGSGEGTLGGGGNSGPTGPRLDNNTLVFVSTRDGNPEIYSIKSNGMGALRLTSSPATDEQPSRSADGRSIVFSSQRDGNAEIYKMNADGSGLVRLTSDVATADAPRDTNPVFSPDGSKIVWQSTRAASAGGPAVQRFYIMDASGANQRPVVFGDVNQAVSGGSWNPDNNRLLGLLANANASDLALIAPGDGTTTPATSSPLRSGLAAGHPRYSPAGARIVLSNGSNAGQSRLQLLNADGSIIGDGPDGGVNQQGPSFNPEGTRLSWEASPTAGQNRQIYVGDVTAAGTQPTGVAITTEGENYDASWTQ